MLWIGSTYAPPAEMVLAKAGRGICALCHSEVPKGVYGLCIANALDECGQPVEPMTLCIDCCDRITDAASEQAIERAAK